MNTSYINGAKVINHNGKAYRFNDCTRQAVSDIEWATRILSAPDVTYDNGKQSHAVADEIMDKALDALEDHLVLMARAI